MSFGSEIPPSGVPPTIHASVFENAHTPHSVAVVAARTNVDTSANTEVSVALTLGTFGVAGVIIGTMATKNGIKAAVACKGALKDAKDAISAMTDASAKKKAQDALKQKLETSWPKYKDYSFVEENGVFMLVKGDKC